MVYGGDVRIPDFLRNIRVAYHRLGFIETSELAVQNLSDLLQVGNVDLEGIVSPEQLTSALRARVQELGGNEKLPPWLRIAIQYCEQSLGQDAIIEQDLPVDRNLIMPRNPAKLASIGKRRVYTGDVWNYKKWIPRL